MAPHPRLRVLFVLTLLCTIYLSGCVDVNRLKSRFEGDKGVGEEFFPATHMQIAHRFTTVPGDLTTYKYRASNQSYIPPGTRWLKLVVELTMVPGSVLSQNLSELAKSLGLERHLKVTLRRPAPAHGTTGQLFYELYFNETVHFTSKPMENPSEGYWSLEVEAQGVGNQFYHDEFRAYVLAYELIRERG